MFSEDELSNIITETNKTVRYKIPNHYRNWALVYLKKHEIVAEIMGDDGTTVTPIAKIIPKRMPIGITESEKRIISHIIGKYGEVGWKQAIKAMMMETPVGTRIYGEFPTKLILYFKIEGARQRYKQMKRNILPRQSFPPTGLRERKLQRLRFIWDKLTTFFWLGPIAPHLEFLSVSRRIALFYTPLPFSSPLSPSSLVAVKISPSGIPLRFVRFWDCSSERGDMEKSMKRLEWLFEKLEGTETGLVHYKSKKLP